MNIRKQFSTWKWGNKPDEEQKYTAQRCAIFTNCYCKTFQQAQMLVSIARADFPALRDTDIEIVIYGGDTKKGIMGIEFDPADIPRKRDEFDPSTIPDSYERVRHLDVKA